MLKQIFGLFYYFINRFFIKDVYGTNLGKWFFNKGDETLLLRHSLDNNSIVFDVGGYVGDFSDGIVKKYDPYVYIFEPVKSYFDDLIQKYKENPKVKVFNFGLSDVDRDCDIGKSGETSSTYQSSGDIEKVKLVDIVGFVESLELKVPIALVSINIEGGEYPLLKRIIESGLIKQITALQVQFHRVTPDYEKKREQLIKKLCETHEVLYSYPFVWEGFKIRGDS